MPGEAEISGTGETIEQMERRCNTAGALERYDDCYLVKVYNEINEIWADELDGYRPPRFAFFQDGVDTSCGMASAEVGPFYCPPDEEVFIDLGFLEELQRRFGATGRTAQAYILAHEIGHHLQTLQGTEREVRAAQRRDPSRTNDLSIAMELQADCFAGVWGRKADARGSVSITDAELDEALRAAAAVGDDRIQRATQGRVDPESWTHGSAAQRRSWYRRGFDAGALDACDTF
jgi:predicted metalloprotease